MHVKESGLCIFRCWAKEDLSVNRLIGCHRHEYGKQSPGLVDEYSTNLSSRLASMYCTICSTELGVLKLVALPYSMRKIRGQNQSSEAIKKLTAPQGLHTYSSIRKQ